MRNNVVLETKRRSYSNVFVSMNRFMSSEKVDLHCVDDLLPKMAKKLTGRAAFRPKSYEYSITAMPQYYAELGRKNLIWIHDNLTFEPELVYGEPSESFAAFNAELTGLASGAYRIISPSQFTKEKLVEQFRCDPEKIEVIYYQLDSREYETQKTNEKGLAAVQEKYRFSRFEKNILFIASAHFRKNLRTAVSAFDKVKEVFPDSRFVVVSAPREDIPKTLDVYESIAARSDALLINGIPRDDLISLISSSDVLLNPTLEEGFGLPNVEAQLCGVPVVSSTASCVPEILGNSAVLVDPLDFAALADACTQILRNEDLRSSLVEKGYANCRRFTDPASGYGRMLDLCN